MSKIELLSVFIFCFTAGSAVQEAVADIDAFPDGISVQSNVVKVSTDGQGGISKAYIQPDPETNIYTINEKIENEEPAEIELIFEVNATIPENDNQNDHLISEWYDSRYPNDGQALSVLSWWWWTGVNNVLDNPNFPYVPMEPNNPNTGSNTSKGGVYSFKQSFKFATPTGLPTEITAALYPNTIAQGSEGLVEVVTFLVNVDRAGENLIDMPANSVVKPENVDITVGVGDRISFSVQAGDFDNSQLDAIEWYVSNAEALELNHPLRTNTSDTLNELLGAGNEDNFNYCFREEGDFEVTVLAYYKDESNNKISQHTWNVTVEEPLLMRAIPSASEVIVLPDETKMFSVLADPQMGEIDGICWQYGDASPVCIPITEAAPQGDLLSFAWDVLHDDDPANDIRELTATAYIEDPSAGIQLTNNTVTWLVYIDYNIHREQELTFSGIVWKLKHSMPEYKPLQPGLNYFPVDENVYVDEEGLHLKIRQSELTTRGGRRREVWTCAELFTANSMPRGIYRLYLEGGSDTRLDNLDANVVFSPFFYLDDTREIDIEFFEKGLLQYILQPFRRGHLNQTMIDLGENPGKMTCQIDWQDDRVIFHSWRGHSVSPPDDTALHLGCSWTYRRNLIPESGDGPRLHLNLYLKHDSDAANLVNGILETNNKPTDNKPVHIIIKAIDHPASWHSWRVEQFGERQTLPTGEIGRAQDDPDVDGYPNLLEYALGLDPWRFDVARQPHMSIYQDPNSQAQYFEYTFTRRRATEPLPIAFSSRIHNTAFLDYHMKSTTDLGSGAMGWVDEPVRLVGEVSDLLDGTERVTYRTENSINEDPRKFFQLQIETRD